MNNTKYENVKYGFTPRYLTKNEKPWFPMMGEFHFSRYPKEYWREAIYKMQAGGMEIISVYVFWLHHEEVEGEYDFSGQRDLRAFVNTVKECGMTMFLRIGPWCHGEARNGGVPDWLLKKDFEIRTNDERYFEEVKRYYKKIAEQVRGLFFKDGGPIIGLQIENEYGHCGGLRGEAGEEHMRRLTRLAKEAGMEAPYYTATGWGGAVTGGLLPVMGGYCEAPWDQRLTEIEPSGNYIFTKERNDSNIGSDYGFGTGLTFAIDKFPHLTAELGGGLQVTHHRRPVAHPKDIGAMSMVKLGCGVNLLGYYMYHGGTNPKGRKTTLQESKETGYPSDLPVFSYDFAAPIREFGQMSQTSREIKLLAMFIKDFGSLLCEMETYLPKSNPLYQTNFSDLRTSIRRKGKRGYLFVNNFQRRYKMADHLQEVLKVETEEEIITYPGRDIYNGDFFFLPFYMPVGDGELKSAMATPLCTLNTKGRKKDTYVFYTDVSPSYEWVKEPKDVKVITLTREEALDAWKIEMGEKAPFDKKKEDFLEEDYQKEYLMKEYLLLTKGEVIKSDASYQLINRKGEKVKSYPALLKVPEGYAYTGEENGFFVYECKEEIPVGKVDWSLIKEEEEKKIYELDIHCDKEVNDCFLRIDFGGDTAKLYIDGVWEADWFYTGETWEIGLKRYNFPSKVRIEIKALEENAPRFLESQPEFKNGKACDIYEVSVETEKTYEIIL